MQTRAERVRGEFGALVRLAVPIIIAQAGQSLLGVVDTAVAGRAGPVVLGAVGLANALFFATASFGMGMMMGVDPLVSQAVGAGDTARARRMLWQGVWLAVGTSALLGAVLLAIPGVLPLIGIGPEVSREATAYLLWRTPSMLPLLLYMVARAYLQASGRTRPLAWAVISANVFHMGAAVLLLFGGAGLPAWMGPLRWVPAMGAPGLALSTTLSVVLELAVLVWTIRRMPAPQVSRRPSSADVRTAMRVGAPIGAHMLAEVGVFALAGLLAGRLGEASIAAHQIAITYGSLTFNVALGIGHAGSVRVGWAVGARDAARARLSGWVAFASGVAVMSLSALVFFLAPGVLGQLMTDAPDVLAVVTPLLVVCAAFQVSDGLQGVGAGVLRGAGETHFTFLANMVGHYGVGLPVALLLGLHLGWGVIGIWWGLCLGLSAVALALVLRFRKVSLAPLRPLEEQALQTPPLNASA
ncbi:MAG: MATE family efflux transporter [Myxococcaceae bacterium]|nr:MATE family efflux transporter [Myxococcaceae bacterium]MCI0668970.1 MATE family efflux transporter [Myxococcaceae bacterium]